MSWSYNVTSTPGAKVGEALAQARARYAENAPQGWAEDQALAAEGAAIGLIGGKTVGDPDERVFNVFLSGHGNENHEPAAGWANDCITVNVSQV